MATFATGSGKSSGSNWPSTLRDQMASARLVVLSESLQTGSDELRVFIGQPRATERTKTSDNQSFAGATGCSAPLVARRRPSPLAGNHQARSAPGSFPLRKRLARHTHGQLHHPRVRLVGEDRKVDDEQRLLLAA